MKRAILLTLTLTALAALGTISYMLNDWNRPRLPPAIEAVRPNAQFLAEFQARDFNQARQQEILLTAEIEERENDALMQHINSIAMTRRWVVLQRSRFDDGMTFHLAVPTRDFEEVRRMGNDLAGVITQGISSPVIDHPNPEDMLAVRLRVNYHRPQVLIRYAILAGVAALILGVATLWNWSCRETDGRDASIRRCVGTTGRT